MTSLFTFKPVTEEDLAMDGLLPKGTYQAEIQDAQIKIAQSSGNEGINLKLMAFDNETNKANSIFCWLYPKLLKHLCDVTGLIDDYSKGQINPEKFKGALVNVILDVTTYTDNKGVSRTKNNVIDFVGQQEIQASTPMLDDDVPF